MPIKLEGNDRFRRLLDKLAYASLLIDVGITLISVLIMLNVKFNISGEYITPEKFLFPLNLLLTGVVSLFLITVFFLSVRKLYDNLYTFLARFIKD